MKSVYEYTNDVDDRLEIRDYIEDEVLLKITHNDGGKIAGVSFPDAEAPAVALAILEAAGIKSEHPGIYKDRKHPERMAMFWLEVLRDEREAKSEREAEDAKVQEFRESSMTAIAAVFNESNADPKDWGGLSETNREGWRARYRAARRFFEGS